MVGRSNVGKSSLINAVLNRKGVARVSQTPGKTQAVQFYLINEKFYLVDLPGYGYAKVPKSMSRSWVELVSGYLESAETLRPSGMARSRSTLARQAETSSFSVEPSRRAATTLPAAEISRRSSSVPRWRFPCRL